MRRMLGLPGIIILLVAACGGTGGATPTPEATSTPEATPDAEATPIALHAVPADSVVVTGTATCTFGTGLTPEGGPGFLALCELDLSDPRVSGTERSDRYRFHEGGEVGSVWVAEEVVLTNAEGTWRGITQAADDTFPCGESHYVGEGAYEGLEFHYYFCHVSDEAILRGWISGGG